MLKYIISVAFTLLSAVMFGQTNFIQWQAELKTLLENLARERNDSLKLIKNNAFKVKFKQTLEAENSFLFSFDSLQTIGKLVSEDQMVKVYTWNIHLNSGEFLYFGFIQNKIKKTKDKVYLWELTDQSATVLKPATDVLSPENWFGALYYEIIAAKKGKSKHYLLLGWDGNTDFSTKKLIEPLLFGSNGKPKFGAAVFVLKKGSFKRIIFEYSKRASMALRFDKKLNMIVFDHLSPSEPKYKDNYAYYGPDFSFDAFKFKKGKWVYIADIDARNKE